MFAIGNNYNDTDVHKSLDFVNKPYSIADKWAFSLPYFESNNLYI